jgi:hypothetical protein
MGQKIKKLKKIRIHREGTDQLVFGGIALVAVAAVLWMVFDNKIPFWAFLVVFGKNSKGDTFLDTLVRYGIFMDFANFSPISFGNINF